MRILSNQELNAIISGEQDRPPAGTILHLFCNSGFVAASDSYKKMRDLLDLRVSCGVTDGGSIVPLDILLSEAYVI